MQKLGFFKRLFMSWEDIVSYVQSNTIQQGNNEDLINSHTNQLKNQEVKFETIISGLKDRINDLKESASDLRKVVEEKNHEIKNLKSDSHKSELSKTQFEKQLENKSSEIKNLELKLIEAQSLLSQANLNNSALKTEISNKLNPLTKIDKTFFGSTGNKGKGVLGEMQLEEILIKSDLDRTFWMKNLMVGTKVVEFAMKGGIDNKWVPIDSKVLDADLDEDNKVIIDKAYCDKVKTQAKKVSEYTSKKNTADYGILVLQSDSIYMSLYDNFPNLFKEIIESHKVYVLSPSSFVQFAWSLSNILDVYKKVNESEKLYSHIVSMTETTTKFGAALKETYKNFKSTMESHYPALEKKQNKLTKLIGNDKIKQIASLDGTKKYKTSSDLEIE